jgi:sugar lactone lactonase YvrE
MVMNSRSLSAVFLLSMLLVSQGAWSVETQRWEFDGFKEWSKGEALGVEIGSAGEIAPVWTIESREVPARGIWSMAVGAGGVYLGTGNEGRLFLARNNSIKEIAKTSQVAVTRIRIDSRGRVYLSAIPGGVIYRLDNNNGLDKFVETGEGYVWDFVFDSGDIVAATGPNGKILRISAAGRVKSVIETGEKHVMCLLRGGDGKLYAGTSGEGLVLEITGAQKLRVVHDFDEREVKRLVWAGPGAAGKLLAAVNKDAGARPPSRPPPAMWDRDKDKEDKKGDEEKKEEKQSGPPPQIAIDRPAPGGRGKVSGSVYLITDAGGARELVELPKRAAVDMVAAGDDVYVATDQEGKVYRLRADSSDYAIAFDLEPSQALSLAADEKGLLWIGTGAPAALVKIKRRGMEKAGYTTEVMDAGFPARWGAVSWQADGPVRVLTRSGNIKDPKRGWSQWQDAGLGKTARIKSPDSRYLQVRVEWPGTSRATLKSLTVNYRVHNQPHYVEQVSINSSDQDGNGKSKKIRSRPGKSNSKKSGPDPHATERKIVWKINNPDKDRIEYKLFFQPEGTKKWVRIKTPEPVTKTKFSWDTASMPDGWYRIKVVATDAPSNPPEEAVEATGVSERFLVDNRPPEISGLSASRGKVSGKVTDTMSAVSGIQFCVDGGEWIWVKPDDGVLDSTAESFKFNLPEDVEPGLHIISVRAWDRALNMDSKQVRSGK